MVKQNPYVILGVSENATKKEILEALKYKISVFCDSDGNGKDANGDYYQQLFYENAQMLLDCKKRKEIDEYLMNIRSKNGLAVYKPRTTNDFITYINKEIIDNELLSKFKINEGNESKENVIKQRVNKRYALIGADGSFMFAWEEFHNVSRFVLFDATCYYLTDTFTEQVLTTNEYLYNEIPWRCGKPFDVGGVKTLAVPASKVVPVDMICMDGTPPCILLDDLKCLQKAVSYAISQRPEIVDGIFEKYVNDTSYKRLGKKMQ